MTHPLMSVSILLLVMSAVVAADPLPIHYWAGETRIDTAVDLDRVAAVGKGRERTLTAVAGARDAAELGRVKPVGAATTFAVLRGGTAQRPLLLTRTLVVGLHAGADAGVLAAAHGCRVVGAVDGVPGCIVLAPQGGDLLAALVAANTIHEGRAARFAMPLIERQHSRRGDPPNDPLFVNQWHLKNTGAGQVSGGVAGQDINVTPLWDFSGAGSRLGAGINVAMVDDGLETTHEDLAANVHPSLGRNFNGAPGGVNDPTPSALDFHGTWTAGLVAARDNTLGGVGVAPRAKLVGVRLIAAATTEADDGSALTYQATDAGNDATKLVHVSSNSWGPDDRVVTDPTLAGSVIGPLRLAALQTGTSSGRGGRGIVYVWAAGNGRELRYDSDLMRNVGIDNLSYDGLASSRYVIAVGATIPDGTQAAYSENGPALLVNAGGGAGAPAGMVTTDRTGTISRPGEYTTVGQGISGTSFSTPVVSGVVALMLEANPLLTWRDVKHVLVRTSTKNDSGNADWRTNGAGREHNVRYGFGRVNAFAAVTAAAPATWVGVPPSVAALGKDSGALSVAIPDNSATGVVRTLTWSAGEVPSGFRTEYVELTVSATHTWRGDLRFRLTSPSGMVSDFERRPLDDGANLSGWIFTSAAHWGESPTGTWTLTASDEAVNDTGTLTQWSLAIHGYLPHVAPVLGGRSPSGAVTGSGDTQITVTGSGFQTGVTQVRWNGTPLATTVVSATQAIAIIPTANLAVSAVHTITVTNRDFESAAVLPSTGMSFTVGAAPAFVTIDGAAVPIVGQSTGEDVAKAFTVVISDADTAAGTLTLVGTSSNQAVVADSGIAVTGNTGTRTVTVTPMPDASGSAIITLAVSDGVFIVTTPITLNVTAVNDPPVAFDGTFEVPSNQAFNGSLGWFDPDSASVTAVLVTNTIVSGGSVTITNVLTGAFTYTPPPGFTGLDSFTWQAWDWSALSPVATTTLVVMASSTLPRPRITSEPSVEVVLQGGGTWTYTPTVSHTSATTLSVSAPATIIGGTTVSWPIAAPASGNHVSFVVVVKDGFGVLDYQQIILRYVPTGAPN